MRKILVCTIATAVLAVLAVSSVSDNPAEAARGGGKPSTSTASLAVSPNPVPLGSTSVVISGSGFGAGQQVQIITGFVPSAWATANSSGSFSVTYDHEFTMPDSASMQAWSTGNRPRMLASVSYTVQ